MATDQKELLTEVPQWAIRAVCGANGRHLLSRPKDWWSGQSRGRRETSEEIAARLSGLCEYPRQRKDYHRDNVVVIPVGNLGKEEYRFWIGCQEPTAQYAMCRFCHAPLFTSESRQEHQKATNCCANLCAIYKHLLAANPCLCVVCGEDKTRNPWGIPFCADYECMRQWKFNQVSKHGVFENAKHECMAKNKLRPEIKK